MSMKQTMCEFVHGMSCEEVCKFLGEIVRCRDCKHLEYCRFYAKDKDKPSGFCAWGARREP